MTLTQLHKLVTRAKSGRPPKKLLDYCEDYYSPYYHFMYLAARQIKGYCVELGCEKGRGLLAMALSGQKVIGIDSYPAPELFLLLQTFPEIEFYNRQSLPVWGEYFKDKEIGLLHIDTEHSYSQARAEFEGYQPYLSNGAVVIFDDLHAQNDSVLKYFNSLPYDKIQDDDLHPSCGWGVVLYQWSKVADNNRKRDG